ncbi:ISAzo13 family transposase, partial [Streptomyces sp. NPDC006476]
GDHDVPGATTGRQPHQPVHPVPGRKTAPGPATDPRHADTRIARPHLGTTTRPNNPRGNPSLTVIEIRAPAVPEY